MWIILLVFGVIALYAGYQYYTLLKTPGALKAYQSNITMQIGVQASTNSSDQYYSDYVTASEAMADELVTSSLLSSPEFTGQVCLQMQSDMDQIGQRYSSGAAAQLASQLDGCKNAAVLGNALSATRTHSLVTMSAIWSTPAGAWAIANAAGEVSAQQINKYLDYVVRTNTAAQNSQPLASARVITAASDATLVPGPQANRPALLLVLLVVALVIGIALALLIEYLDDRIWSRETAIQVLQLPVYGEVPHAPAIGKARRVSPAEQAR
jgi:capsular polysaccharide biosynthesis protein